MTHTHTSHYPLAPQQCRTIIPNSTVIPRRPHVLLSDAHSGVQCLASEWIRLSHVVEYDLPMIPHHVVGICEHRRHQSTAPERRIRPVRDVDVNLDAVSKPGVPVLARLRLQDF